MITKNPMQFQKQSRSLSEYRNNFILKSGFLIAAIVGLDTRATMDLGTTIKGFPLTHESIREILEKICAIKVEDDITFTVLRTTDIREGDDYPGLRVSISADYLPLKVPLTIDVTTRDCQASLTEWCSPLFFSANAIRWQENINCER